MKRKLIHKLLEWKNRLPKKPILLIGAKGVGKTYLAIDFATDFYENYIYINFENDPSLYSILFRAENKNIQTALSDYFKLSHLSKNTLLILDEIGFCPDIRNVLHTFKMMETPMDLIAISSYKPESKEQSIPMYFNPLEEFTSEFEMVKLSPLDFEEFLIATSSEWYIGVIKEHFKSNLKVPDIVHGELLELLETFLRVGGMPLAVNEYISMGTGVNIAELHKRFVYTYLSEVNNNNAEGEALKINQAFKTIPNQLFKKNKKFQYTLIRKGATQSMYKEAISYIENSYYGISCNKLNDDSISDIKSSILENRNTELDQYKDIYSGFKLYLLDVGLLHSLSIIEASEKDITLRKGIIENYVAQSLDANGYPIYFWESNSQAKIDFVIPKEDKLLPIEVFPGTNTRSKNVSVFRQKVNEVDVPIKISNRNFSMEHQVKFVPIYAVFCL